MRGILRPLQSAPSTIPIRWEMPDSGVFQQDLRVLHLVTRLLAPRSKGAGLLLQPPESAVHQPLGQFGSLAGGEAGR